MFLMTVLAVLRTDLMFVYVCLSSILTEHDTTVNLVMKKKKRFLYILFFKSQILFFFFFSNYQASLTDVYPLQWYR